MVTFLLEHYSLRLYDTAYATFFALHHLDFPLHTHAPNVPNHGAEGLRWPYHPGAGAVEFRAVRPLPAGAELLLSYSGAHSGRPPWDGFHFLTFYGFVEDRADGRGQRPRGARDGGLERGKSRL